LFEITTLYSLELVGWKITLISFHQAEEVDLKSMEDAPDNQPSQMISKQRLLEGCLRKKRSIY
jgi:hypothetical protein